MAFDSREITTHMPPARKRPWPFVFVAVVAALAVITAAFYFWPRSDGTPTRAPSEKNPLDADFSYGVATVNKHPFPEGAAALASTAEGDSVRSVVVTGIGIEARVHDLDTWGGILQSEFRSTEFPGSLTDILHDPYGAGLCAVLDRPCDSHTEDPATADGLTLTDIGHLRWDPGQAKWVSETQTFDANLVFGSLGGYLIGNRTNSEHAGAENTSTVAVDSITAFSIATGEPVWTKELPHVGFVAVGPESITVIETPVGEVTPPDYTLAEDTYIYVEQLVEAAAGLQIYELVAATTDNTEVLFTHPPQAPASAIRENRTIEPDAIRSYDFANGPFPRLFTAYDRCSVDFWRYGENIGNDIATPTAFNKVPRDGERADNCNWYTLSDGASIETETLFDQTGPVLRLIERDAVDEATERTLAPGGMLHDRWFIAYQDLNGDGYLDAVIPTFESSAIVYFAAIFDPETPHQPYMTHLWGTQSEEARITEDGSFEIFTGDCVTGLISIDGTPPRYSTYELANMTAGECL